MSRRVSRSLLSAALVVLLGSPSAFAQKHDKHRGKKQAKAATVRGDTAPRTNTAYRRDVRDRDVIVFDRDGHRRIITDYYSREGLPPGLAKRESLPPGLAKQLRERGRLPPGLQKRLYPVPQPLLGRLPASPPYYSRYFVGRDLVVLDRRTQRIVAIVPNVL
jgi:hypothetical protein